MITLWFYDYFLTLDDEVTEFRSDNGAERSLILSIQIRYAWSRENKFSREPSQFPWSVLADSVSVFVLFLLVSTLHSRHYAHLDRHLDQICPSTILFVGDCR